MKQKLSILFFLACIFVIILSSCEGMPVVSSQTSTSTSTPPPTIRTTATPTLNYKAVILTPDDVFSLPEIPAWSTPNSEDFCEHLPTPHVIAVPNDFSVLSGRFVLCIYERAFIAMDLDAGNLVPSDDENGDIVLGSPGGGDNPTYGLFGRNNAYVQNAYVNEAWANHPGANNLSYEYCENNLQSQTDHGGIYVGNYIGDIACVKTTEGQIALIRVEKIYPATTLSVEFSFAILRKD